MPPLTYIFPCILGFASALPLVLFGGTLQAWATEGHLSLMAIGYLSLIAYPYAFKFLWAPFVDRCKLPFWRGHRRGWILSLLLCLAPTLYFLSLSRLPEDLFSFVALAALGVFISATLDISIDAYRTESFPSNEYGLVNACYVSAYRMGMLVSGGLGLVMAGLWGWKFTYQIMSFLILLAFISFIFAPEETNRVTTAFEKVNWRHAILDPLVDLLHRKHIIAILALIILYKFGEALGSALLSTFLLRQLHFSLVVLGGAYKTVGIVASIVGAFIGGLGYKKYGFFKSFFWFGVLQALGILWFYGLAIIGKNFTLLFTAISFEALTGGMATTVFLAFLMRLCQIPYTATQFALFSACASLGRIFTGPLASWLVEKTGWPMYFLISFLSCLPGLVLLWLLKNKFSESFSV